MKAIIHYDELMRLLKATKDFVAKNSSRYAFDYIRMEFLVDRTVRACGCDGFRLSTEWGSCGEVDEDFVTYVKPETIEQLNKCASVELYASNRTLTLKTDMMSIDTVFNSEMKYIDVEEVIPSEEPSFSVGVNGKFLIDAIKASSKIATIKRPIILSFGENNLKPIVIKTKSYHADKEDVKLVLPMRFRGGN